MPSCSVPSLGSAPEWLRIGEKQSVDIVHTLAIGLCRNGAELARIAYVFGTSLCFQGWECSSSPTSGTVFYLVSGFLASECAFCSLVGHFGGLFHWWPVVWPVASLPSWIDGLLFVTSSWAFLARRNMTW